jgi:tetratricopeptide (TPR) repeat protein
MDATLQLSRAYELRERALGPSHEQTLELLLPIAESRSKSGDIEGAFAAATDAYTRYAEAFGPESERTRAVALWNARWLASGYRFAGAERYFDLAELRVAGTPELDDPITLAASVERIATLVGEGKLAKAEVDLRAAGPQIARLDAGADKIRKLFMRQFSQVLTLRGKPDEAIELLQQTGTDDLADRVRERLLAWSLGHAGQTAESESLFASLLELEQIQPGPKFREIFLRLYHADVLLSRGEYEAAANEAVIAIDEYDANGFQNDPDRLWGRMLAGRAWIELGELDRARAALQEADSLTELFPEYRLRLPELRYAQAKLALAEGDRARAGVRVREAITLGGEVFGESHQIVESMRSWRKSAIDGDGSS